MREPRYAIKTRTDTEVMDDGYKWRKYGQKAVKNSPHPRYHSHITYYSAVMFIVSLLHAVISCSLTVVDFEQCKMQLIKVVL